MRNAHRSLLRNFLLLPVLCATVALQAGAADPIKVVDNGLPGQKGGSSSSNVPPSAVTAAVVGGAILLFPEQVLAGFTNGQDRVAVIVNLVSPAQAMLPADWHKAGALEALHAANRGVADDVLNTLAADEHKDRFRFDNQAGFSSDVTLSALQKLLANPRVESIEPVHELQAHLAQGIPLMNALATRPTYNGAGIAIAICDTGIDYNHPRLGGGGFPNSKVIGGYDFGDNDADPIPNTQAHGTCCAGIAAGDLGTAGDYIGGVAPGAKLYACKISYGTTGSALNDAMVAAWDWCVTHRNDNPTNPIMVISTSFGGGRNYSTCDSYVTAMTTAANNAVAAGITVLASSGNDGYCDSIAWPACISSVISVGAVYDASFGTILPCVDVASCVSKTANSGCPTGYYATDNSQADRVASYANVAPFLGLFAPGNNCYTTDISGTSGYSTGDYYDSFGGTSASCPYAAGAVACLQQSAKALTGAYLTPAQVFSRLASSGNLITDTKVAVTRPRINLGNAIATLIEPRIVVDSALVTAEGCLPGNGAIDPNETVTVAFTLKNTGLGNTTNLVATLLATNGVVGPSGSQTYGPLLTNGVAVSRAFTFTATGVCGGALAAVIQLQDGSRNLGTLTNVFMLGVLSSSVTNNYSSGGVSVAIANNTTIEVPIAITDSGVVADVNARVRLNHGRDSDLVITLVHPDGTLVTLVNKRGGSGKNFGSGANDCSGTFTVFDDAAAASITNGAAPFAGSYRPESPLSALNGKAVNGTWKLRVADTAFSQTGTFYCFQLDIGSQLYSCCTASTDLGLAMTASPDPVQVGQNLTYTLMATNLGPQPATSVTITDTLPAGVTFVSASPGCTNLGARVVATVGTLTIGGSTNFNVVVAPTFGGFITNIITIGAFTPDPYSANNSVTNVTVVSAPPGITGQPGSQTAIAGTNVTFQVVANGTAPLVYQWRFNGADLAGAVNSTLTLTNVLAARAGSYSVLVTNLLGSALSSNALLTVRDPWITSQPQNQSVAPNAPATFTVGVSGTAPLGFQWSKDGVALAASTNISGTQTSTLTVARVQVGDLGSYSVAVTNLYGQVLSSNATLTANFPPVILTQPVGQTLLAGSVASFTVGVAGSSPITLHWRRAGTNLVDGGRISGSATASLIVSNAQGAEMAVYSLVASNAYGSVASSNAFLALWPLVAWGRSDYSQSSIPGGVINVTGTAAGLYHSLALRSDGVPVAWGAGTSNTGSSPQLGQAMVPAGLGNVMQVAAGYYHSLALKSDGTAAAWGAGTTNTGASPNLGQAIVPAGLSNAVAVAAGGYHSLALKSDGAVVAWGAGTTNSGVSPYYGQAIEPNGLSNAVAVAAGGYHSLALKSDGAVVAWGAGAVNTGVTPYYGQAMVPDGLGSVVSVAAGGYHSVALKSDGTVVAWGDNTYGQTNTPAALSNVVAVAAGRYDTLALKADGTMVAWGDNAYGQTNLPVGLANVVGMAGGGFHLVALQGDGRPAITVQPFSQNVRGGTAVRLQAMAAGLQPLSWQWQHNGTNLPGATAASLTLASVQGSDAGAYALLISNSMGTALSSTATLTVSDVTQPTIACPADVTVPANSSCSATNVALGTPVTGDDVAVASVTNNGAASYAIGTNLVTWTVTDSSGNSNSCQQRVIVLDSEPPVIAWCFTNRVLAADTNCQALMPDLTGTNYILAVDCCGSVTVTQSVATNTVLILGAHEVVLAAFDAAGNAAYCTNYVVVADQTPPLIAWHTTNVVLAASTNCQAPMPDITGTSYVLAADNCGSVTVTQSVAMDVALSLGTHEVVLGAVDGAGNAAYCAISVLVVETTPPSITCPLDVTVNADAGMCAAANVDLGAPVIMANCGVTSVTNSGPASYPVGTNLVTWIVTDSSGNSNSCQQRVIVLDIEPPVIAWYLTNVVMAADTNCQALMPDLTGTNYILAQDYCGSVTVTQSVATNTVLSLGAHEVVLAAFDAAGNAAYCTNYIVVADQTPPLITWHTTNVVLAAGTNCQAPMPDITGTNYVLEADNCGSVTVTQSVAMDVALSLGTHEVVLGAVDGAGNAAYCAISVLVVETTSPSITCPLDVTVNADAGMCAATNVDLGAPVIMANCGVTSVTNSGAVSYPVGTNLVTWTVTDSSGNSNSCQQRVIVLDIEPPAIAWCFTNMVLAADTNCQALMPDLSGTNYILAQDYCGSVTVTQSVATNTVLSLGAHEVVLAAFDAAGNAAYCTNYVVVTDQTPPSITWHTTNVVLAVGTNCQAPMPDITGSNYVLAVDNCGSVTVTQSVAMDVALSLGTHEVVLGAVDSSGNAAYCAISVLVVETTPPSITCPLDVTVNADAGMCAAPNVDLGVPVIMANCGVTSVTNNGAGGYPVGTNLVTWTVTDSSGNSNSCQQRVIVLDGEPPVIAWYLTNVVMAAGTNCQALMPDLSGTNYILAHDYCSSVTVTQSVATNTVLILGTHEVVLTAFDAAGNAASCTNYVAVADQTPPSITCPPDITVASDPGQCSRSNVTWEVAAGDNCAVINLASDPPSGSTFSVGVTIVRCVATDTAGNTNGCSFTVTVVAPAPILEGPTAQTVPLGQTASFCVSATNQCGGQPAYQWRFNGTEIPGATTNCYAFPILQLTNAGSYDVVVMNAAAAVTSSAAILTVVGPYLTPCLGEQTLAGAGRTNIIFTFPSVPGINYVVQYRDALTDANDWRPAITNPGTGGLITNDFPITADPPGRFYRVLVP